MHKLWGLIGALALLNVAVAGLVFVAPGFVAADAESAASAYRLPGVIDTLEPRAQPFWFIRVPRAPQPSPRSAEPYDTARSGRADAPVRSAADQRALPTGAAPIANAPESDATAAAIPAPAAPPTTASIPRVPDRLQRPTVQALVTPFGLYPAGYQGAGMALLSFVTFLALGCATAFIAPDRVGRVREAVQVSPRRLLVLAALGMLTLAMTGLIMQALFMLVVSLVLTPVVAAVVAACMLFGLVAMFLVVGSGIRAQLRLTPASPLADLAIGMLAVFPLTLVPAFGWVVLGLLMVIGTGAVIATRFGSSTGWSLAPLAEDAL